MKKLIAAFISMMLLFSAASAEYMVESMTDDQIYSAINILRNELLVRFQSNAGKVFIVDDDLVSIYFTGKWTEDEGYHGKVKEKYFAPEIVLVNKTEKTVNLIFDRFAVNGWEMSYASPIIDIGAGNKKKGNVQIFFTDVDIEKHVEIEDFNISLHLGDNDNGNKSFADYKDIVIPVDSQMWE